MVHERVYDQDSEDGGRRKPLGVRICHDSKPRSRLRGLMPVQNSAREECVSHPWWLINSDK